MYSSNNPGDETAVVPRRSTARRMSLALLLLLILPAVLRAATLTGYVRDAVTKETLIGATLRIKGTKIGAVTNRSGFFSIKDVPAGRQTIVASYIGYTPKEIEVELTADESRRISVELNENSVSSNEVVVTADRNQETREIEISRVDIPVEQLKEIRIGGEPDVFRALQYLPGVLSSSQISSGLFIRGGSPDQNLVLVDGATVYNPSHLFGFYSTFNADAIKDVELIKGGFPAEYGGRLSAVLNLTQKDGNRDEVDGVASLGLIASRLSLEGPLGNGSWFLGGRRTYLDLVIGLLPESEEPIPDFYFYDANARILQEFGPNDRVSVSAFTSRDELDFGGNGLDFSMGLGNLAGSARWTHIFGDDLFSSLLLSASNYETGFTGGFSGNGFEVENTISDFSLKTSTEWYASDDLTVKGGVEATQFEFNYLQTFSISGDSASPGTSTVVPQADLTINDLVLGGYGQISYQLDDLIGLQAGVRGDYLQLSDRFTVDPRLALRWIVQPEVTLKAAWGIYHQYLRLSTLPDFSFFDTWLPTDSTVVPSKATHYVLGVETQPFEGFDLNLDLYYKQMKDISELNQFGTRGRTVAEIFYSGTGESYGAELFLQKRAGDLTGWIGYGLGFIDVRFDSINGGADFRPKYDRRHDFKLVAQYRINDRWDVGASFVLQSGQSYTAASSRFGATMPGDEEVEDVVVPAQRYGERLPPSHQLNVNANYNTTLFGLDTRVLVDIFNVYSRRDIWFRYYDTRGEVAVITDVLLLPILPSVAVEIRF